MSSFASAIIEKSVSDRLKSSMSISAVDFLLREYPGSQDHRQNPDRQVGIFVAVPHRNEANVNEEKQIK